MKSPLTITAIKRLCKPIFKRSGVKKASVFGSQATGLATKHSDVDIIFTPPTNFGLLELAELTNSLENVLKTSVDLVTERSLHPLLKKQIKKEALAIL